MDVLFILAGDATRASTRYRVLNMLPFLEAAGVQYDTVSAKKFADILPGPDAIGHAIFTGELLLRARNYDVVFLQKVPLPAPCLAILKKLCDEIVYDFDDAIYTAPKWKDRENQWKSLLDQTLRHSSLVITGSPVLSEYAQQFASRVICLPTALPADQYSQKRCEKSSTESDTITLGWIGNPENIHYLASIEEPLEELLDQYDNVKLHIITAGDLPVAPLRDRPDVAYKIWTLEDELDLLSDVDIGLRPLFDDEWTRGKGGYTSVVQKMALGIPVVATPVGMITEIVEHGHSGYHAESSEEWIQYVSELIDDDQKRAEFGQVAREAVSEQQFWTEQRADEWIEIFERLRE